MRVLEPKEGDTIEGVPVLDYCHVHHKYCQIEIKSFYLYQVMFANNNAYLHERMNEVDSWTPYLPLVNISWTRYTWSNSN